MYKRDRNIIGSATVLAIHSGTDSKTVPTNRCEEPLDSRIVRAEVRLGKSRPVTICGWGTRCAKQEEPQQGAFTKRTASRVSRIIVLTKFCLLGHSITVLAHPLFASLLYAGR